MKIQFVQQHIVRGQTRAEDLVYEKDQIMDFKGRVEESYARAYIERGYAVEIDAAAARAARKAGDDGAEKAAAEKAAADAAATLEADTKAKAEADAKLKVLQQSGQPSGKA